MIDDSEYHWRLIAQHAESCDMPLRHYPYLARALASQGVDVNLDWTPATVQALCRNLMAMRTILAGDDE